MNICMYVCMYVLYAYIRVCMNLYVYACMYICMHVCIHVCIYVIFKLSFEWYGGNCPSWEGELSGRELSGGIVRGELPGGKCPFPLVSVLHIIGNVVLHCIVFRYFYSASLSMSHSGTLPATALILCRSLHAEALLVTSSERLA